MKQEERAFGVALMSIHAIGHPEAKFEDWSEKRKSAYYRDLGLMIEANRKAHKMLGEKVGSIHPSKVEQAANALMRHPENFGF